MLSVGRMGSIILGAFANWPRTVMKTWGPHGSGLLGRTQEAAVARREGAAARQSRGRRDPAHPGRELNTDLLDEPGRVSCFVRRRCWGRRARGGEARGSGEDVSAAGAQSGPFLPPPAPSEHPRVSLLVALRTQPTPTLCTEAPLPLGSVPHFLETSARADPHPLTVVSPLWAVTQRRPLGQAPSLVSGQTFPLSLRTTDPA